MEMTDQRAIDILRNANLGGVLREAADYAIDVLRSRIALDEAPNPTSQRKILCHADGEQNIWTYYVGKQRNPCGCGSNCYHYEFDGKDIFGVCNACYADVYQVKEEFIGEYLERGVWK